MEKFMIPGSLWVDTHGNQVEIDGKDGSRITLWDPKRRRYTEYGVTHFCNSFSPITDK